MHCVDTGTVDLCDGFRLVQVESDSRRTFIWKVPVTTTRTSLNDTVSVVQDGSFGGIGTMTGQIYRNVILKHHVRLFRGAMDVEFVFMDDNNRPQRANIVSECLHLEDIIRKDCPAFLPDLNPIQHVWNMLGQRVAARQPPPTCLPDFGEHCLMSGVIFLKIRSILWYSACLGGVRTALHRLGDILYINHHIKHEILIFVISCQVIYSQFGLAIHQNDHQARRRFVEWAQNEIAVVPDFHKRILYSDEAHFWLNGYVNKQNYRIWSEANPQVYVETPLHPEKLTVWCALWAGGIIGPYFFKNDEGHNITVNGDRYRAMITNFFITELNNYDVQELWFQQDGATCHTARATIDLLKDTFDDRLISRFGPVNWPPRSCDLTPLDYFLWGYVKSLVYADKPQTLDHLEDNIRRVIADIRPQMLEKVIENWTSRLDYIRASRGSPIREIIFKM
ncbi:DUF4817 domain-containing protein [Trichonephila clavipes]|uniref:DUF4817 domain-containing protein n=1 Tax=Trichonephila clavipes TaxID=2585209 RepID=A0A8X6SDZ5_TRICX|nr:DUF4817 domain-containing protein [Trichonephila clavipes]